jgi:hypothetical protein
MTALLADLINNTEVSIADRFAQIEAEYKAIKDLYEAVKEEALAACMDACGPTETKSTVDGERFTLKFSLTDTTTFSAKKAKEFLTEEQIAACMEGGTRRNLKADPKATFKIMK